MEKLTLTFETYKISGGASYRPPLVLTELTAARGGTAAFGIVWETGRRCVINPGRSPALTNQPGLPRYRFEVRAALPCRLYTVGLLPDEDGIERGDILYEKPLIPDGDLPAHLYAELRIPADCRPGVYPVSVTVYAAKGTHPERVAAEASLALTVKNCVMPAPETYRGYLDLWQHPGNVARAYGVEPWGDAHFRKLETVLQALFPLGQRAATVVAGDCPWRGWGCYLVRSTPADLFEYSMVSVTKRADGTFSYDFSALERYLTLCSRYGMTERVNVYGIMGIWTHMPMFDAEKPDYPEPVLIRYRDETDGCYKYLLKKDEIEAYLKALFAFFERAGLWDAVRIASDEPKDIEAYRAHRDLIRSIRSDAKFSMAIDDRKALAAFGDLEDVSVGFGLACSELPALAARKERLPQSRTVWYVCNVPDKPNSFLRSPLTETRSLGALRYLLGLDGLLRWAFTCWTADPRRDIRFNCPALPAGDVALVYPAEDGGLLSSLRYKAFLRGTEDYQLLLRLRDADPAAADAAVRRVVKNAAPETYMTGPLTTVDGIVSADAADYEAMRASILDELEKGGLL